MKKSFGGNYIALLEHEANEIIIITPDLYWDLHGGFTDVVLNNLRKGKKYTYFINHEKEEYALRFLEILRRNKAHIKGQVNIYLTPYPIIFEIAVYKFAYKPPVYILVADRDDSTYEAIDIDLISHQYKSYIDKFIEISLKNFIKNLNL